MAHNYIGDNIQVSVDVSEDDFNLKRNIITDAKVEEERDGESDDQFQDVESHVAFNYQTTEEQLSPVLQ